MKKDFESYKQAKPFRIWDIAVYAVVLLLIIATLLVIFLPRDTGGGVEIYLEGKLVKTVSFQEYRYPYVCEYGGVKIWIENGEAYVTESDCPDKYCVKHSHISKKGESIICLPNQVIVKVYGGQESEVAGVTK